VFTAHTFRVNENNWYFDSYFTLQRFATYLVNPLALVEWEKDKIISVGNWKSASRHCTATRNPTAHLRVHLGIQKPSSVPAKRDAEVSRKSSGDVGLWDMQNASTQLFSVSRNARDGTPCIWRWTRLRGRPSRCVYHVLPEYFRNDARARYRERTPRRHLESRSPNTHDILLAYHWDVFPADSQVIFTKLSLLK